MDLDLLFLGTAGSAPTASRGTSSTLLRRGGDRLLLDCGEGTQRQLLRSDAGLVDLEHVFLTHLHADHVLGLPGMLKTFALRGRDVPIAVHGPRGTKALLDALAVVIGRLTYELRVVELVAEGLTNPQIGERMFISRGTVKVHLSHIFAKLGTATRAELAAEATRRGVPTSESASA